MAEIRYYRNIGPVFTDKYGQHNITELLSTNGGDIVCIFAKDRESQLTLQQVYSYVLTKTHDPIHVLVKMVEGKIQGIAIFTLREKSVFIEYLCSSVKGSGAELLDILKQFVIEKGFQSITLEMSKSEGLPKYYEKQGFRNYEPLLPLSVKWDTPKGGRKRAKRTKRRRKFSRK